MEINIFKQQFFIQEQAVASVSTLWMNENYCLEDYHTMDEFSSYLNRAVLIQKIKERGNNVMGR
jgi:hypothetical protein